MHNRDYYDILGLSSSATPEQIRQAYRRRARECHPDHGGSHDVMVALNEAYFVLSDRGRRTKYDLFRRQAGPGQAVTRWQQTPAGQETHAKAAEYPQEWAQFERWMNALASDIRQAKYGQDRFYPTVEKSVSGSICIIIGGALWTYMMFKIGVYEWMNTRNILNNYYLKFMIGPVAGAWAGQIVHSMIKETLADNEHQREPGRSSSSVPRIMSCPECGQKLRVPAISKTLDVTCGRCKYKFNVPSGGHL